MSCFVHFVVNLKLLGPLRTDDVVCLSRCWCHKKKSAIVNVGVQLLQKGRSFCVYLGQFAVRARFSWSTNYIVKHYTFYHRVFNKAKMLLECKRFFLFSFSSTCIKNLFKCENSSFNNHLNGQYLFYRATVNRSFFSLVLLIYKSFDQKSSNV